MFTWVELFSNVLSVIIWKQNFEKLNITGAIAPLQIGPITIPSSITSNKCSNFQTVTKFEIFSTSSSFSCLPLSNIHLIWLSMSTFPNFYESCFLCGYLIFYCENRKTSMNNKFFFHFTYTHQISRKSAWKYRFPHHPLNPRSKLETLPKMEKAVTQKGIYRFSWNLNCIFD